MNSIDIITTLSNNFTKNTQTTQTEQYILLRRRRTEGYKKSKTNIDYFIILCWQRKEEKGQQREETGRGKSIVL